jgi:hypothetical protein
VRGASAPALAGAILLTPGNTGSRLQEISDGVRVRINPDERAVRIERRVDNGLLGTGIGAKWQELPVEAEQVDTPDGRRIAIDGAGLERAIGEGAFAGLSTIDGIQMARPPSDGDEPDDKQSPAPIGHNNPPGPLDPAPPALPIIKKNESATPDEKGNSSGVPGRVQSRINLANGNLKAGWIHVTATHFNPARTGRSQFSISQSELRHLLQHKRLSALPWSASFKANLDQCMCAK